MEDLFGYIITAVASIVVAMIGTRKALNDKDLEIARTLQSYEDRLRVLEKFVEQYQALLDKLNGIENNIICVQQDLKWVKEKIK